MEGCFTFQWGGGGFIFKWGGGVDPMEGIGFDWGVLKKIVGWEKLP